MAGKKEIDEDRYYFNPKTKEKIYSHYKDGTEISLSDANKKKAEEASKACTVKSIEDVEKEPSARKKPLKKRGREPKKKEEDKK